MALAVAARTRDGVRVGGMRRPSPVEVPRGPDQATGQGGSRRRHALALRRLAANLLTPGVLLLVRGSIGWQSVVSFLVQDRLGGVRLAFSMSLVASSLVAGMWIASADVPSRRLA